MRQTFWAVKKISNSGKPPMWWEKGTRAAPGWSKKLTPNCLYHSKLLAEKLLAGEGSGYFEVDNESYAIVAKVVVAETIG